MGITTLPETPIRFRGYTIRAAGFDQETFSQAITRAIDEGLTIRPGHASRTWYVWNPSSQNEYATGANGTCTCPASVHGSSCKHVALVMLIETIIGDSDRLGGAS